MMMAQKVSNSIHGSSGLNNMELKTSKKSLNKMPEQKVNGHVMSNRIANEMYASPSCRIVQDSRPVSGFSAGATPEFRGCVGTDYTVAPAYPQPYPPTLSTQPVYSDASRRGDPSKPVHAFDFPPRSSQTVAQQSLLSASHGGLALHWRHHFAGEVLGAAHGKSAYPDDASVSTKDESEHASETGLSREGALQGVTTLCVHNIPFRYTQDRLLEDLKFPYNFLYLPYRGHRTATRFAFVNFETPEAAERFRRAVDGTFLPMAADKPMQPLSVAVAETQGFEANMLLHCPHDERKPKWNPAVFDGVDGLRLEFDEVLAKVRYQSISGPVPTAHFGSAILNGQVCWSL